MLVRKAEEVKAFRAANTNARGTYKGANRSGYSSAGLSAGRAAGDKARLSSPKSIANPRSIK